MSAHDANNSDTPQHDVVPGIEAQRAKAGFVYTEDVAPGLSVSMTLEGIVHTTQSPYQKIDVIDTYFGRTLVTDGKTQSTEFDEFAYHESLVHPSLLKSAAGRDGESRGKNQLSVFIGGGGELATAREVLRHKSVGRVVMVDLDGVVIDVCKKYLSAWGGEEVASDPRLELIVGDAYAHLMSTNERFDAIVMDISDPIEAGPGIALYTQEFYAHAKTLLNPNGVFVTQAGVADSVPPSHAQEGQHDTSCFGPIQNTLRTVFDCVVPYASNIPSFGSDWGFVMAYNLPSGSGEGLTAEAREEAISAWADASPGEIDELIESHITQMEIVGKEDSASDDRAKGDVLRFYDGTTHRRIFALTKPLRQSLEKETRVMTKENPIFMF